MFLRLAVAVALLAGCAARALSGHSAPAYADVNRLLTEHPFYSQLRHYDEQIAALQRTAGAGGPLSNDALAHDITALQRDLDASAAKLRDLYQRSGGRYDTRRKAAISSILSMPVKARSSDDASVADAMLKTYRQQQQVLRAGASRDMQRYGNELTAQQNAAYRAYVDGVEDRLARAYALRAQQLQEREGTLALDLARKDMQQRLALQLRLKTLRMNAGRHHDAAEELRQIDAREAAVIAVQRRKDEATLSAYRAQLEAQGRGDIAAMAGTLQGRARANYAARKNVYAAQTQSAGGALQLKLPPRAKPLDARAMLSRAQEDRPQMRADASLDAFTATRNDLLGRLTATKNADADANRSALAEIDALQAERDALRLQMRVQIERLGIDIAQRRGLQFQSDSRVGATDITAAVRERLKEFNV